MIDVAIVGAGPTGLALANLLGQSGVRTVLIERNSATASEPRAVIVDDESMRCFQAMGLADRLIPNVREGCATKYLAHPHAREPFATVNPQGHEYGWPKRLRVHQPDLEEVLKDGLERFPNVELRYDTLVDELALEDGRALLTLGNGERLVAHRVVACDGGGSPIRRKLGITTTGDSYEEPWLVLDLIDDPFDPPDTLIICDPARPAVAVPGPNKRRRFEFMVKHGEDRERFLEPAVIDGLLADYGYGPDQPATVERKTIYVFHARCATRWREGAVVLAGDAAHMMPPFMGQGLNSCIRDAWNLAWKLALEARGVGGHALIDSYEIERRPHVEKMIDTSVTVAELAMTTNRAKAALRNLAFRVGQLVPPVKRAINGQFFKPKPEYRDGLFVLPPGERGPVAAMLPQPHLGDGRWLDELLGQGFALVGLGVTPVPSHPLWRALDTKIVALGSGGLPLADAPNPMTGLLTKYDGQVLLVRPDRMVAGLAPAAALDDLADRLAALIGWQPVSLEQAA